MIGTLDSNFNNGTIKYINDLSVNIVDFKCYSEMIYSVANDTTNNKITLIKQNNSGDIIDYLSYDISANNNINAISLKIHNNSIFVLGDLSNNNYSTFFISSFNLDLSKNIYFNNNGIKIYDNINQLELVSSDFAFHSNNDIFVSAFVNNNDVSNNDFLIVKFDSSGQLDNNFGSNGTVIHDISGQSIDKSNSILINNNSIFLGGHTITSNNKIYYTIGKYDINGTLDISFGSNGFVLTDLNDYYGDLIIEQTLTKLSIQDNKIIAFGSAIRFTDIDPTTYSVTTYFNNVLIRYNYDTGILDSSFGDDSNGIVTLFSDNNIHFDDMVIDKNNKIIVSRLIEDNGKYNLLVERFNKNGEYDTSFSNNGTASYDLSINTVNLNLLNLKIDIDNNDRIIVCGNYYTNENIMAAIIGYLYNNVNICFPRDTPVITDQGSIMIQNIDIQKHTLNGKKVVAVTESIPLDENIVVIEKDALFKNMPSQQTKISQNHRLLFKGEMVKASELVDKVEGAYLEKYNKEVLYNVLLDTHEKMIVNNLICETLDPGNMVALLYKNRAKMSNKKYLRLVGDINKTVKEKNMLSFIKIGKRLLAM